MSAKPTVEVEGADQVLGAVNPSADIEEIPCADLPLVRRIEALLFAADRPLSDSRIADLLGVSGKSKSTTQIRDAVEELNATYLATGCAFKVEQVAGGRQVLTLPAFAPVVARLRGEKQQTRLTQPAIETLAIVAYRQPVSRARVSAIRGVNVEAVMKTLVTRGLVEEYGVENETGAILYKTTSYFLERLGLNSLTDLPPLAPHLPDIDGLDEILDSLTD